MPFQPKENQDRTQNRQPHRTTNAVEAQPSLLNRLSPYSAAGRQQHILHLQTLHGNQSVQRMIDNPASVQRWSVGDFSLDDWRPTDDSNTSPAMPVNVPSMDRRQETYGYSPPPEKTDVEKRGGPAQYGPDTSLPWSEYLDRYVGPKSTGPGDPNFQSTNQEKDE